MQATTELTCVINVRNGERFLEATLESLRRQSAVPAVLIVDNQSTDSTPEIAKRFPEFQLIRTPSALSLGAARNFGLEQVRSPYVAWLDADDLWEPKFVETSLHAFRALPSIVAVHAGTVTVDEWGEPRPAKAQRWLGPERGSSAETFSLSADDPRRVLKEMSFEGAWCSYAFSTEAAKACGAFDPSLTFCEDFDFMVRLLAHGRCGVIAGNLSRYRVHASQLTRMPGSGARYREMREVVTRAAADAGLTSAELAETNAVLQFKERVSELLEARTPGAVLPTLQSLFEPSVLKWLVKARPWLRPHPFR